MGFELNRIMKQYGVSTPGMAPYTGTPPPSAPKAPTGERPAGDSAGNIGDDELKERQQVYDQQLTNYNNYIADPHIYKIGSGFDGRSGATFQPPTRPSGDRPGSTSAGSGAQAAYDKQLADFNAYNADPNALNEQMRKYGLDQKSYDEYKTNYQNRLQNTPMYSDSQFQNYSTLPVTQTGGQVSIQGGTDEYGNLYGSKPYHYGLGPKPVANTVADLYKMYLGRDPEAGIVGTAAASTRPNFIQEAQRELSTKPNFGNQNLMDATGSYYGNQLKNPTYGAYPVSMINDTPQQQSDYYLQQRNLGYTDADLRNAKTNTFGKPVEGDWAQLMARAYPDYNANLIDAYKSIGRSWEQGTIDAPSYNSWMNNLSSGAFNPKDLKTTFAKNLEEGADWLKRAQGGSVYDMADRYADGGPVDKPLGGDRAATPESLAAAYPQYDEALKDAYKSIGRSWEQGTIDAPSYNSWMNNLSSGAFNPKDLKTTFAKNLQEGADWLKRDATPESLARDYPQYNADLIDAYKSIGRSWEQGTIDAPSYNSWMNNLSTGAFNPQDLKTTFAKNLGEGADWLKRPGGGGGSTTKDKLEKAAINAALSYAIGPTYDYANAGRQLIQGDVGGAIGSAISGATGGVSKVLKKFRFEDGGSVKTHYQTAGEVRLPSGYISPEEEEDTNRRFRSSLAVVSPTDAVPDRAQFESMPPVALTPVPEPRPILTEIAKNASASAPVAVVPASAPVAVVPAPVPVAPKAAVPFGNDNLAGIQALLAAYGPKDSAYAADLKTARATAKADSDAFARMLTSTMSSPEDAQNSKAEIYFRLAAAFGAPTKTGQFSENLGMVGKELGEYAKGKRATAREKQLLNLEVQKLKMASSKEDLNTLRGLSAEEMKDKRAIATELIKNYIESGKPQSAAGKQALDEGLKPGTPEYQKRVEVIGNMNIEAKMAQINSALSGVTTAAANLSVTQSKLDLERQKFDQQKAQQAKLSPGEVKLKVDAEDTLAQTEQAMTNLKKAYSLNPNTFDGSLLDVAQRKLYEQSGSKDPKVVATRELENLLKKGSLSQLKATFPGAISNDERAALDAVQGLDAKSKDERSIIMKNAFTALKSVSERHRRRLNEINQGVYRDTAAPIEEGDK